ncbi:MAG TPA: hypothetical protein P5333_13920 [Caldilinea sp.]|nr:hypothetical protein [Caldilinea sp.]
MSTLGNKTSWQNRTALQPDGVTDGPSDENSPAPQEIRIQVQRILNSPMFKDSEQLGSFLDYVIEEMLAGRADQIKQYTIAVKAFGRPTHFDPRADPIVRIEAGRLRRRLAQYYEDFGAHDPLKITIPTGAYIPVFLLKPSTPMGLPQVAMSVERDPVGPAIVVLPFEAQPGDDAQRFIADGLTEQMLFALNRYSHVLVIAPPLSGAKANWPPDPLPQASARGAHFVLTGRIHVGEESSRVMVRLVDTANGNLLWSDTLVIQAAAADLFLLGEGMSSQVAATLVDTYGVIPRTLLHSTLCTQAGGLHLYAAVLQYSHFMIFGTDESAERAIQMLEQAIQHEPHSALLKAILADMHFMMYQFGADESILERGIRLARQATLLDPQCQHAHFVLAFLPFFRGERVQFVAEMEYAIQLNPNNAWVLAFAGMQFGFVGEWDAGHRLMAKAMALNPHFPGWYHALSFMDAYRRCEYQTALHLAEKFNRPALFWDPLIRAASLGRLGRSQEGRSAVAELLALSPNFPACGRELMYRSLFLPEHVEMLLTGLYLAGLDEVA